MSILGPNGQPAGEAPTAEAQFGQVKMAYFTDPSQIPGFTPEVMHNAQQLTALPQVVAAMQGPNGSRGGAAQAGVAALATALAAQAPALQTLLQWSNTFMRAIQGLCQQSIADREKIAALEERLAKLEAASETMN